jgi:23S rRNA (pseudouridine1915-N3)-methyltransferase
MKVPFSLHMGMKVNIRIVGKKSGGEPWLDDGYGMYQTRLRPSNVEVETTWHKDNQGLIKGVNSDSSKGHTLVLLDPLGLTRTSEKFSDQLFEWLDRGGSRLSFVIGGAEGLPSELKYPADGKKPSMISLSSMTFTHQMARLLLIEQIYRGTEIRKGSGYHK